MRTPWSAPYNGYMTTTIATTIATTEPTTTDTPLRSDPTATAELLVASLAACDFAGLASVLDPDVRLDALLPRGHVTWEGSDAVRGAFETFFGGLDEFDLLDSSTARLGDRIHLRWRFHASGGRLGSADHVVEQSCYAEAGPDGRFVAMALVCSGFRPTPAGTR